ncbi:MAG: hypothetical protein JWO82_887 [Akkermansiaceae bacterium]|nr:hypothetical protein [Akkermansiaceae bacterium]
MIDVAVGLRSLACSFLAVKENLTWDGFHQSQKK